MEPLLGQARAFFMTIGIGAVAAFGYDYYRAFRQACRLKKFSTFLGDLFFWLITTAMVFALLLRANWGEMRMYVFLGLGLGALLYFHLFSKPVSRLIRIKFYMLNRLWHYFVLIISYIWYAVLAPFRFVFLLISYPFRYCSLLLRKFSRGLKATGKKSGGVIKRGIAAVKTRIKGLVFWRKPKQ